MRILVGLGNPGRDFGATRHNVGFRVAEVIRRRHGRPREARSARIRSCRVRIADVEVLVARPQTYMNRSGQAVAALLESEGVEPDEMLVVCDDLHLDLGELRLRARGSHGGHNGLRSIIESIGTEVFPRLRLGIGPSGREAAHADFVLAPFSAEERRVLLEMIEAAADCAEVAVTEGLGAAMTRFNGRRGGQAIEDGAIR